MSQEFSNRQTKLQSKERIFLSPPHMSGNEVDYVLQAFNSNYVAPAGPQLNQFEATFRELTGFRHCVAVASGTAAMHLALRSLNVGPGDVVLASTLTFIGSVSPITYQGAEIVFVDSDRSSWNMDPTLLAEEIDRLVAANKKPKAVIPTELYGQPCDLDEILAICRKHEIEVICDSAESLGAEYHGRSAGKESRAAIFSFNGNKIITTSGGGMLASDDEDLIDHCRYLSTQARQPCTHYEHTEVGFNYRMSNIVAAIGIGQLEVLNDRVSRKREIFDIYQSRLAELPGVEFMPECEFGKSTRWLTVATIDASELGKSHLDIIQHLESINIESRPVWKPMHLQPAFDSCRVVGGQVAESLFATGICLPSGTAMSDNRVHQVCDEVLGFVQ